MPSLTVVYEMTLSKTIELPDDEWDASEDKLEMIRMNLKEDEWEEITDHSITEVTNCDTDEEVEF